MDLGYLVCRIEDMEQCLIHHQSRIDLNLENLRAKIEDQKFLKKVRMKSRKY